MSTPTLRTVGLGKRWGLFDANKDINLSLHPGSRHALIGPNGAGKTTLINLLTGAIAPTSGSVLLDDADITHLPQHLRVKRGMTRTFQPFDGPQFLLIAFGVVIIGGLGSIVGSLVGGVLLGIVQVLAGTYFGPSAQLVAGYMLILVVLAFLLLVPPTLFFHWGPV